MRRALTVVVLVLVAGILAWEFIPLQKTIWDGSYELTVHIDSSVGRPRSVTCETSGSREHAEQAAEYLLPPVSQSYSAVADPFDGRPLPVNVATCGGESPFGRDLGSGQSRFLVVIAELPDGRRVGKLVKIPEKQVSRKVTVALP
jgi:hypothetical protein